MINTMVYKRRDGTVQLLFFLEEAKEDLGFLMRTCHSHRRDTEALDNIELPVKLPVGRPDANGHADCGQSAQREDSCYRPHRGVSGILASL
jgi:hypothetical protein